MLLTGSITPHSVLSGWNLKVKNVDLGFLVQFSRRPGGQMACGITALFSHLESNQVIQEIVMLADPGWRQICCVTCSLASLISYAERRTFTHAPISDFNSVLHRS